MRCCGLACPRGAASAAGAALLHGSAALADHLLPACIAASYVVLVARYPTGLSSCRCADLASLACGAPVATGVVAARPLWRLPNRFLGPDGIGGASRFPWR
jgi:hypothetical protein